MIRFPPPYDFLRPRKTTGNWAGPALQSSFEKKLVSSQYISKDLALPLQFCQESSLHGLKFVGHPKRHPIERFFWAAAFCTSVILATISIHMVWKKYKDTPIITIFKPVETPVRLISFPAVTICSANAVDKKKAEKLIERARKNDSDISAFHKLYMIEQICQGSKSISEVFEYVGNQGKLPEDVRKKVFAYKDRHGFANQSQSISEFIMEVTDDCHSMILLCIWNGERQNCKRIFQSIVTDFGRCCSFNMLPTSLLLSSESVNAGETLFSSENAAWAKLHLDTDRLVLPDEFTNSQATPKFPHRQNRPGKASGLSIVLNPNLNSYFCANLDSAGFMALAHSPLQFPRMSYDSVAIYPSFETFLQLKADITLASDEISGFKTKDRNCYFGNEYPLQFYKYYTMSNCEDECVANLTFIECGCVFHFMPRNQSMEVCVPQVIKCAEDTTRRIIQEGIKAACKMCLPSCTDIQYSSSVSYLPLRNDVELWKAPDGTVAPWSKDNVTILSFYFSGDSTYAKLRTQLYGPIELLSSTGGLLGLCLGFSALSLLEIFYFLTFRMYFDWKQVRLDAKEFATKIGSKLKNGICLRAKVEEWQGKDEFVISYLEPSF